MLMKAIIRFLRSMKTSEFIIIEFEWFRPNIVGKKVNTEVRNTAIVPCLLGLSSR